MPRPAASRVAARYVHCLLVSLLGESTAVGVSRRAAFRQGLSLGVSAAVASCGGFAGPAWAAPTPGGGKAKCSNVEECREAGEARFAELEQERGALVRLGQGISYRERARGSGEVEAQEGDTLQVSFSVYTGSGNFMYGIPTREPGARDGGETYTVRLGNHDVPVAVERALIGAKRGSVRLIEMTPALGFATSDWRPMPATFAGKQRVERYRKLLTGNGLQPGYNAVLLFEAEVQKIQRR